MKFINITSALIDPYKLRKKNFFKKIFEDRKKNFFKFKKLITKQKKKCPICYSKKVDYKYLKIHNNYKLQKCHNCNLIYPNTKFQIDKNYVSKIYSNYSKQNHRKILYSTKKYRNTTFIKQRYRYCIERIFKNKKNIKVLEYGCGTGDFLSILKKKNIYHKGLEVDSYQTSIAKKNGLNVSNNNLNLELNNTYDLCVMFDTLEHLVDPIKELKILNKKIKKGGYLICYSPYIYSLAFELMGNNSNQVYPFEHLYFFGKKSLNILAKKTGFKVKNFETYGLDLMDYFLFREFKDKKRYIPKFKDFINLIQPIIDKNKLGNHFRITLKKNN